MGPDYKVVVSAENSPYIAWQTQLFCFSALTRLGVLPTVVVHRSAAPLLPEFEIIKSWGCPVSEAPLFRNHPKGEYPPRNELGTLLTVACLPEFKHGHVLFCEPDMLFVSKPTYPAELCAEHYTYLNYSEKRVADVARKLGLAERINDLNRSSPIGVPYLLPGSELMRLARRWIGVLDSFDELQWIDIMYAFGLALAVEGLTATVTHLMAHNNDQLKKLDRSIIHYCYGDWRWDKKAFRDGGSPLWSTPMPSRKGLSGTVLGEILKQIQQARTYFQFPRLFNRIWRLAAETSS
jgi:hypothetical protein